MSLIERINIVLVEPTHPGNIGAAARAVKTMGLSRLLLVNPKKFPHYEASKRAAGAEDVLDAAKIESSLAAALTNCTAVYGTSVRDREVSWPTLDPRQAALQGVGHLLADADHQIAIVFGRENSGLSNEELELCQAQIRIPANPEYSSLNLASAVQIIGYECRMAARAENDEQQSEEPALTTGLQRRRQHASHAQKYGHLQHLQQTLEQIEFAKSPNSPVLMRKLSRLYNKAELTVEEVQILRGILSAIQSSVPRS